MEASNNAKLRDLAEAVAHMNDDGYWNSSASICALVDKAKNALAEPVRNCDVGTVDEQTKRKFEFCQKQGSCGNCSLNRGQSITPCVLAWAQMPYEEGGANG